MTRKGDEVADAPVETADRILAAARACFERFGIRKTTIGDIAEAADVSRPTVYKNFASKEAILDAISITEIEHVHDALRERLRRQPQFGEKLTEVLFVSVQVAMENSYVRWFIEDPELRTRSHAPDSPLQAASQRRWRSLFDAAVAAGDLADDVGFDDLVYWLTLAQESLVLRMSTEDLNERRLRRIIRRFIVEPLLSPKARAASSGKRG